MGLVLRPYQEEAVDSLFKFFNEVGGTAPDGKPVKANPLICLPTGTGKSLIIGEFIRRAMFMAPNTRIFMSTHVKTLIKQNADKLREIWPTAPIGINSAGLKLRDTSNPIIFGGIQSSVGKFPLFGRRDLLIVDEAHLISPSGDTSYSKFINELSNGPEDCDKNSTNINPYLKVIGLTATPYRLGLGHMTNGSIFSHVAYDLCNIEGFARLLAAGYLCPLIPQRTNVELDTSNVGISQGDFKQGELQTAVDNPTVTYHALKECCEKAFDRASWLIFASGVEHANHICDMLNDHFGISTVAIHSKKTDKENEENLELWKTGKVRCAVNMNALTTGVDHPACDFIGMLRPTMSPGLWVQMLGRGTRPYSGENPAFPFVKQNCLVLDFAGNTRRLGPINDPVIPRQKGKGPPGDAPVKICPTCNMYNHTSARVCAFCGEEFKQAENISKTASDLELIRSSLPQIETFNVQNVVMVPHKSKAGNDTIRVAYFCGIRTFFEYISVQSNVNFVKHKSRDWFRQRYHYSTANLTWDNDVPETNAEVLELAHELRKPKTIQVWVNRATPEVQGYGF